LCDNFSFGHRACKIITLDAKKLLEKFNTFLVIATAAVRARSNSVTVSDAIDAEAAMRSAICQTKCSRSITLKQNHPTQSGAG
jgi:hypothetical protein